MESAKNDVRCKILVDDGVIVLATNNGVRIPKQLDISISQYLKKSPIVVVSVLVDSEHIIHARTIKTLKKYYLMEKKYLGLWLYLLRKPMKRFVLW